MHSAHSGCWKASLAVGHIVSMQGKLRRNGINCRSLAVWVNARGRFVVVASGAWRLVGVLLGGAFWRLVGVLLGGAFWRLWVPLLVFSGEAGTAMWMNFLAANRIVHMPLYALVCAYVLLYF